jgi:SH3 domain protein
MTKMKTKFLLPIYIVITLFTGLTHAETLYVTDNIELDIYLRATPDSPVIGKAQSGDALTVLQTSGALTQVRLENGTQGWISNQYLVNQLSSTGDPQLDEVLAKLQEQQELNTKLNDKLGKVEREVQVRRDEASNYKTTIKELQNKLKNNKPAKAPAVDDTVLQEANKQIQTLQEQVAKLEQEKAELATQQPDEPAKETDLDKLLAQNQQLQVRIEAALANLQGQTVPTAAELAAIRPTFPVWYWLLLLALFVAGIAGGIAWFDYQHRKKHGGFRI